MADHFEEAKDDILFRTDSNGGPTPRDLLTAMGALARDVDEAVDKLDAKQQSRHDATISEMKALRNAGNVRDTRLDTIEAKHDAWEQECPKRLESIIDESVKRSQHEHGKVHADYVASLAEDKRRATDSDGEDHRPQRSGFPSGDERTLFEMILGWSIVKWLVAGIVMASIVAGISYWTSSCAAERVEKSALENQEYHYASPSP